MLLKPALVLFPLVILAMIAIAGNAVYERYSLPQGEALVPVETGEKAEKAETAVEAEIGELRDAVTLAPEPAPSPSPLPGTPAKVPEKETSLPPPLFHPEELSANGELSSFGILSWTNTHRMRGGLSPLVRKATLDSAAILKMNDMFQNGYFEHESPTGVGIEQLIGGVGYDFVAIGENLALGNFGSDEKLVQAWMDSPGHRKNIMRSSFSEIGIAVGRGTFNGKMVWIAVQEFGRPASECPDVSDVLSLEIDALEKEIRGMSVQAAAMLAEIKATSKSDPFYDDKVKEYNAFVSVLNKNIEKLAGMISHYNTLVNAYNECVAE